MACILRAKPGRRSISLEKLSLGSKKSLSRVLWNIPEEDRFPAVVQEPA